MKNTGRRIVINGLITTDSVISVLVGKSGFIEDYEYVSLNDVENARVLVYQDNRCIDSLVHLRQPMSYAANGIYAGNNYFSSGTKALPGNEYSIVVSLDGFPDAGASTKLPGFVRISFIDSLWEQVKIDNRSFGRMTCNLEFSDPPNEENFYLFNICSRSRLKDSIFFSFGISNGRDPFVAFDCQDPIVEQRLISYDTWHYNTRGIVFSDKIINGRKHKLTVSYQQERYNGMSDTIFNFAVGREVIYFRLYSIGKEYFNYIQSLDLFYDKLGNPLAEPVKVYSNIEGGYGIFAGASVTSDSIVTLVKELLINQ
jgi:hypothetical protein